ncbi:hypothetical protein [Methylobacterium sp. Leaf85]|uniref:hypothetical protein n=1 Tax=Methylobacterium sp. Leaf85 TaxID=1736241 RepID=UPI0006FC383D|nr:hypothetical protein [Methylobacterium sp. Leaf85]KQO49962.1 hypothetical protein ASF08_22770 [Methylobacterium sp. Leaf85]
MPSLKLSNPFRRADGRPSLKERAAALKASAARVIRRPKPVEAAPEVDWNNPPAGFVAYPHNEPAGFLRIDLALASETKRLHALALAEFERRRTSWDDYNASMKAGQLDKLRRRLRLDELARAANPERAISTEFTPEDGTILYEDASGMVHRKPIAQWISFMATRMYAVAQNEANRAFNEKSVPDQEANRPLEDGLRRDLRLDALNDLAFRWDAVFEGAKEHRVGRGPVVPLSSFRRTNVGEVAFIPAAAVKEAIEFARMPVPGLEALHSVAATVADVARGLACQPRCRSGMPHPNHPYNAAGDLAEWVAEVCGHVEEACVDAVREQTPSREWDRETRLVMLSRAAIEDEDAELTAAFIRDLQGMVA